MNRPDDDLHDAWLDASLEERLGGAAPPDLSAQILGTAPVPKRPRLPAAIAAVALVALGLAVILGVRALRGEGGLESGPAGTEAGSSHDSQQGPVEDGTSEPLPPPPPGRPIRVLYIDDLPRWEYRYLKNTLQSAPDVAAQIFLTDATASFVQEHSRGLPALTALPRTAAELAAYDVILIGDVAPSRIGTDEAERSDWVAALAAHVRGGGGLGFLCGSQGMPLAWRGTALVELLPVELAEQTAEIGTARDPKGFAPQLTGPGSAHPILRLDDSPVTSAQVLCDVRFGDLIALGPPRERATVLARADGNHPLFVVGHVGEGRTFLSATDESWRLRDPYGDKNHDRLWRQTVRWLAGRDH